MTITKLLGAVVALSIVSACADTPTQPELLDSMLLDAADRTVKMVPWKAVGTGELDLDETAALDCGTAPIKGWVHQTGTARHLGKFTGSSTACMHLTGPPVDGILTAVSTESELVRIAANGDEVWMSMDPSNPQVWTLVLATGVRTNIGGWYIVGGTGRFEGATGYVTGIREADGTFTTEGTISAPGSIH